MGSLTVEVWLRTRKPVEPWATVWLPGNGVIDEDADPPVVVLAAVADQAGLHTSCGNELGAHTGIAGMISENLDADGV